MLKNTFSMLIRMLVLELLMGGVVLNATDFLSSGRAGGIHL